MVILAAAIVTRHGKTLLSRQFTELSRMRIEGLLTAFPKLANLSVKTQNSNENSNFKQIQEYKEYSSKKWHSGSMVQMSSDKTFVETDSVRYLFQPLENELLLLLITTKSSNIVEDLDTLGLLYRIVKEQLEGIDFTEHNILDKAFDLIFAFDEAISFGYAENHLSLDQISKFLEMDSTEENLQNFITKNREQEAKEVMRMKAAEISKKKAATGGRFSEGFGSSGSTTSSFISSGRDTEAYSSNIGSLPSSKYAGVGSTSSGTSSPSFSTGSSSNLKKDSAATPAKKLPTKVSLKSQSKPTTTNTLLDELIKSGEVEQDAVKGSTTAQDDVSSASIGSGKETMPVSTELIHVKIEEKVNAQLNREGGVASLDIKGEMFITVAESESASIQLQLQQNYDASFQPRLHPNLDKQAFQDHLLLVPKNQKPFPTKTALKVLTWKNSQVQEQYVPLVVTCWPSVTSGGLSVTVEYELGSPQLELNNVEIYIPVSNTQKVKVETQQLVGTYKLDNRRGELIWQIDTISKQINSTGSLEFFLAQTTDENCLWPLRVQFQSSSRTISGIGVSQVVSSQQQQVQRYSLENNLSAGDYLVQ